MFDASVPSIVPELTASAVEHTLDNRRASRHLNDAPVKLETVRGELDGFCVNISRTGLRAGVSAPDGEIRALYGLSPRARILVSVDGWPPRVGRVVWRREVRGGMIVGVAFEKGSRLGR